MHLKDLREKVPDSEVEQGSLLCSGCCLVCLHLFVEEALSSSLSIELMRLKRHDFCDWAVRMLFSPLPNDVSDVPFVEAQLVYNASSGCSEAGHTSKNFANYPVEGSPRLKALVQLLCRFVSSLFLTGSGAVVSAQRRAVWGGRTG